MASRSSRSYPAQRIVLPELASRGGGESDAVPATLCLGRAGLAGGLGPQVVLDFGQELFGGIRLRAAEHPFRVPVRLRVRLGESVSEATAAQEPATVVDLEPGATWTSGVTGFRFAGLELAHATAAVELERPVAFSASVEPERQGAFACSDERLNRIWDVGARTVGLCLQGQVWDGIKRGQVVWVGDLYPALDVVAAVFGPQHHVPDSLDQIRDRTPLGGSKPNWMHAIPGYSLWWIHCQAGWYAYTGDRGYLEAQREYLVPLLAQVCAAIDDQGCEQFDGWRYLDWFTVDDPVAVHVGYQGLTAWALRSANGLLAVLGGEDSLRQRCAATLGRIAAYRTPPTSRKQARALLVLGGLAAPGPTNAECLAPDPAAGVTPYLGYAVLQARALAGDYAGALALIDRFWGAMLDLGATTWWEEFALDWAATSDPIDIPVRDPARDLHAGQGGNRRRGLGLSLCHAWSAGPTAWLSRHVLGVQPVEPGCRAVRIAPWLGALTHVEGAFPTPHGLIHLRHERRPDGSIAATVDAPGEVRIVGPEGGGISR